MQNFTAINSPRLPIAPPVIVTRGVAALPLSKATPASRSLGVARTLTKGEELFTEGEEADFFYKVVSGAIRTYKLLNDGRRQIDAFHLAGDIFGMEAGVMHRFSADAVGVASVSAVRRGGIETLSVRDAALGEQVVSSMMRSLERAQDHMLLLGRKTAQEKIATFLLDMALRTSGSNRCDLPMQRSDIADHLWLTIETVSRTLTQLVRDGVIELAATGRSIVFRNQAALQRLNS